MVCLPRLAGAGVTLVLTADTEGHVTACRECPHGNGLGGLARGATALRQMRGDGGDVSSSTPATRVRGGEHRQRRAVIVEAYNAMGYDAVNLTPRDFRLGKAATVEALGRAKFAVVSANLVDDGADAPLGKSFVVKKTAAAASQSSGCRSRRRVGLPATPRGAACRREDSAGGRGAGEWIPKAKAEADEVVLLYYGSAKGLKAVREKFGGELTAICVGGVRPEEAPAGQGTMLLATSEHGKHLVRRDPAEGRRRGGRTGALDDSVPPDETMAGVVAAALNAAQPRAANGDGPAEPAVAANPDGGTRELMARGRQALGAGGESAGGDGEDASRDGRETGAAGQPSARAASGGGNEVHHHPGGRLRSSARTAGKS